MATTATSSPRVPDIGHAEQVRLGGASAAFTVTDKESETNAA